MDKFKRKLNKQPFYKRPIREMLINESMFFQPAVQQIQLVVQPVAQSVVQRPLIGYTTDFAGRLGNHMFIYAYVRSLAEKENKPFKLKSDLLKVFGVQEESIIRARSYTRPDGTTNYQEYNNFDLLIDYRDKIKNWFRISDNGKVILVDKGYPTVVHVRGTDFNQPGWQLPSSYYRKIMIKGGHYLVITDDVEYAKEIIPVKSEIISTSDDLSILYHAKKIIASHSTYCWWGVFLGEHESVITPPLEILNNLCYAKPIQWAIKNLGWIPV
jgi:hypothetical protein